MIRISFALIFISCLFSFSGGQDFSAPPVMAATRFGVKYDEALEAIFSIAIRLEALLAEIGNKNSKNFMVSPLSMSVAIGQLILGAKGELKQQLYHLLTVDENLNKSDSVRHSKNENNIEYYSLHEQLGDLLLNLQQKGYIRHTYTLKTASVLFKQNNLTIDSEFERLANKFYGTTIKSVDFINNSTLTQSLINNWVFENTNGLIKNLISGLLSPHTVAILANAIYFKGDWQIPFSSEINRVGKFRISENNYVNVTYMSGEFENYKFVDSKRLNCKMTVIPYKENEISMYILLPNLLENNTLYDINKFVSDLGTNDFFELINSAKERKVFMMLPKMSLSNTIQVLEPLKKYHAYRKEQHVQISSEMFLTNKNRFDKLDEKIEYFKNVTRATSRHAPPSLDLSGISPDPRFAISEIYQQMTLSVNEMGTEAAAVSASAIDYILDSVSMRVDRPFLFFIRHEATEASLFWGTIVDPTEIAEG